MKKPKTSAFIILGLVLVAVAGITLWWVRSTRPYRSPVILISVDTLRADHVGAYGYSRDTTPNLDALAAEGVVFERAFSHSPNTAISHATMLTGLRPLVHGCAPGMRLMPKVKTLAEYFKEQGYATGGFATHGAWLSRQMGFDQGFDEFYSAFVNAPRIHEKVLPFLDAHKDESFFLFLHYYDVHSDYTRLPYNTGTDYDRIWCKDYKGGFTGCQLDICASELLDRYNLEKLPMDSSDVQYITDLYDGGVRYTDHYLGILFQHLKDLGIYKKALIVVTADHGEEFREHGNFLHTQFYNEVMHVPLIVKLPGRHQPRRVSGVAGLVDITPTLLDFAAITGERMQGHSLLPQARGEAAGDPERVIPSTLKEVDVKKARDMALRTDRFTFTTRNHWRDNRLYDFRADPREKVDVSAAFPRELENLLKIAKRCFFADLALRRRLGLDYGEVKYDEAERKKLKSLGYL